MIKNFSSESNEIFDAFISCVRTVRECRRVSLQNGFLGDAWADCNQIGTLEQEQAIGSLCSQVDPRIRAQTPNPSQIFHSEHCPKFKGLNQMNTTNFQKFPVDALPCSVSKLINVAARANRCDESFFALPILSVLAAAIGNTRRLEIKEGYQVPPVLWTLVIGESGSGKKSSFKACLSANGGN